MGWTIRRASDTQKIFGNTFVRERLNENLSLGTWVGRQTKNYYKYQTGDASCSMTTTQIQRLKKLVLNGEYVTHIEILLGIDRYKILTNDARKFGEARVPPQQSANIYLTDGGATQEKIKTMN